MVNHCNDKCNVLSTVKSIHVNIFPISDENNKSYNSQWFSAEAILPSPRRHLAISGDILDCPN